MSDRIKRNWHLANEGTSFNNLSSNLNKGNIVGRNCQTEAMLT